VADEVGVIGELLLILSGKSERTVKPSVLLEGGDISISRGEGGSQG